jgi:hypothetical protein
MNTTKVVTTSYYWAVKHLCDHLRGAGKGKDYLGKIGDVIYFKKWNGAFGPYSRTEYFKFDLNTIDSPYHYEQRWIAIDPTKNKDFHITLSWLSGTDDEEIIAQLTNLSSTLTMGR